MELLRVHDVADVGDDRCVVEPPSHTIDDASATNHHFGQRFVWHKGLHRSAEELEKLRHVGDPLMDEVLDAAAMKAQCASTTAGGGPAAASSAAGGGDFVEALAAEAERDTDGAAARLLHEAENPPPWVDFDEIARGAAVFQRHIALIPVILYNFSLVGGFSAPKITSVLDATGYLTGAPEAALKRLTDTGRFVFDIAEAGALRPWQPGWKAALRVRAKHARVRRLLRKRGWPETPLNAADVMVTQLAFSYNVIVGLEIILGSALRADEASAYLALWRWAGALLGLPDEANACADGLPAAKAWLESYIVHQLHPTALSQRVAHHLLDAPAAVAHRGDSEQRRRVFTYNAQLTRLLIGDALGDALDLPFCVASRRRALRSLRFLRVYGRLCRLPLLGSVLGLVHRTAANLVLRPPLWLARLVGATRRLDVSTAADTARARGCPL